MMTTSLPTLLAAATGVTAHIFLFRRGEWDVASPSILGSYAMIFALAMFSTQFYLDVPPSVVAQLGGWHAAGLYLSMLLYRAFFHRLAGYPGPFLARLTNFYITALSIKKLHLFEEVQKLHAQYGDYVRLGPRELSIADPEAVKAIYGTQSPTTKGPWYTLLEPRVPVFMARDKQEHAHRRKIWDKGFTTKALLGYDPRITTAINNLLAVIDRQKGQPLDVSQWFAFLVFDVMEDLAFNKSSNMLLNGKESYIFKMIRTDMYNIAFFTHLPWLLPFLKRTPILNRDYLEFLDWIQRPYACVGKRLALLEIRRVVAEILSRYDVTIAPGQTKGAFLDGKQDTFTTVSASLPVIFTERVKAK
ncbi:hypothetical protein N0V88_007269 [Collariella sp. IMI 366227]|nr:hypothetical protein N0V88_007269 [Collariella sp. IMI 366227]